MNTDITVDAPTTAENIAFAITGGTSRILGSSDLLAYTGSLTKIGAGGVQIGAPIAGAGITINGGSLRLLNALNNVTGVVDVQNGTLSIGIKNVLGNVTQIRLAAGTTLTTSNNVNLNRSAAAGGTHVPVELGGTARIAAGGANAFTIDSGISENVSGAGVNLLHTDGSSGSVLTLGGTAANTSTGTTTVSNTGVHANDRLTQLRLSKSVNRNAIGGDLTIGRSGFVRLRASGQIPDTATVNLTPGGRVAVLNLAFGNASYTETIGSLNGDAGSLVGLGGSAGGLTVNGGGSFAGTLAGQGGFTKSGSGTLTLSGVNRNTGPVVVSGSLCWSTAA